MKKITGITSVDGSRLGGDEFTRLIQSGLAEVDCWIIVIRFGSDGPSLQEKYLMGSLASNTKVEIVTTGPCGISRARNAGISRAHELGLMISDSIFIFPDDDCWFVEGYRAMVMERFQDVALEFLITPYGPSEETLNRKRWPEGKIISLSENELLIRVSSAGLVIRGDALAEIGVFDERLGVGSALNAGEDIELALWAKQLKIQIEYDGDIFMLHEYKSARANRALGNAAIIHAYRKELGKRSYVRAIIRAFHAGSIWWPTPVIGLRAWWVSSRFRKNRFALIDAKVPVGNLAFSATPPIALIPHIANRVASRRNENFTVVAAHISSLNSSNDAAFQKSFNQADFAMVDGISISLLSGLLQGRRLQKMATTDFVPDALIRLKEASGMLPRVAIVGGEEGIAALAGAELEARGLAKISFTTNGYWADYGSAVAEINRTQSTVLLVGLGMPLEAIWVDHRRHEINAPLIVTCGGLLRLLAGTDKRAPELMQRLELEWLWRLLSEPRRTGARYRVGIWTLLGEVRKGMMPRRGK